MTDAREIRRKVAYNIGLVVLRSQYLERNLKLVLAVMDQPGGESPIHRHERLQRRPLGGVVKGFLDNVTVKEGCADGLEAYFHSLVYRRNDVVHHFFEVYGEDLEAGNGTEVLKSLAMLCEELLHVATCFRGVNKAFMESLQGEEPIES